MRRYTLFLLHKYSGLAAGLILALLAFTGFFLDHENFDFLWQIEINDRWIPASMQAKKSRSVEAYRVDVENPQHILVGSRRGFYLSRDGGASFSKTLEHQVLTLDVHRAGGKEDYQRIYVGTTDGIFFSQDGGGHWKSLALSGQPITGLTVREGTIHAVVDKRSLYRVNPVGQTAVPLQWSPPASEVLPQSITLGRLVRDLHYGRGLVDGDVSLYFNDFLALLLLMLSVSGYVIYIKVRQRRKHLAGNKKTLKNWITVHAHGSTLPAFFLILIVFGITGVFLDHSSVFRSFLKSNQVNTTWLPPVYRSLSTDVWGFDYDGKKYRIGNRLGIFSSKDLHNWQLESTGFAWRMKRLGDELLVSGMGGPNQILRTDGWQKLNTAPHMPRDFYLLNDEINYLSLRDDTPPLPHWNSVSLYHILLGPHDGELLWGQWVWLNDLAVLAALLLLYTGFLKWMHRRRHQRSRLGNSSKDNIARNQLH